MTSKVRVIGRMGGRRRLMTAVGAVVVGTVIAGGVAFAAIPDTGSGVFHGCVSKVTGVLRVTDPSAGQKCLTTGVLAETPITWNQTGPTGPTGPTGLQGPQGDRGLPGAQGPQGAIGAVGPQGATGANGAPGATGAVGAPGPKGDAGQVGPQGAAGATGPQGAAGPASLSSLQDTACVVGGAPGTVDVATDATTGAVSITCRINPVTVVVSGGSLTHISIVPSVNTGQPQTDCFNATSCGATNFASGDFVQVRMFSRVPFVYTCPGLVGTKTAQQTFPNDPFEGSCQSLAIGVPYKVTATIGG